MLVAVEMEGLVYGAKPKRMDFNTQGGNVLLLELSSQMTLDESGLISRSASDSTGQNGFRRASRTLPVPPSPTNTSLKVGVLL